MTAFQGTLVSRILALGLLVAIAAGVYLFGIAPVQREHRTMDAAIADASMALARFRAMAKTRPALESRHEELSRRHVATGIYLEGATDALAAAALQEKLSALIQANGGALRSIQVLPARTDEDFKRIGLRVQITANLESLFHLLYALEAGETVLFVDNLDIMAARRPRRGDGAAGNPTLTIRFDMFGYLRPVSA